VQLVEILLKRFNDPLYKALGIYLPLITTNCAILGVAFLNVQESYNLIESVIFGFAAGVGFLLALVLMSGIRERLELSKVPRSMQGVPIAFIVAALMSMAFMAFAGMVK
jgi:electron transport complex protein RnfA